MAAVQISGEAAPTESITIMLTSTKDGAHQLSADSANAASIVILPASAIERSRYLSTLFSKRWARDGGNLIGSTCSTGAPPSTTKLSEVLIEARSHNGGISYYRRTLSLLAGDLKFDEELTSVQDALCILKVSAELLYEDGIRECLRYLEAVPWSEDQDDQPVVQNVLQSLQLDGTADCKTGTLARLQPLPPVDAAFKLLLELVCNDVRYLYGSSRSAEMARSLVTKIIGGDVLPAGCPSVGEKGGWVIHAILDSVLPKEAAADKRLCCDDFYNKTEKMAFLLRLQKVMPLKERLKGFVQLRVPASLEWLLYNQHAHGSCWSYSLGKGKKAPLCQMYVREVLMGLLELIAQGILLLPAPIRLASIQAALNHSFRRAHREHCPYNIVLDKLVKKILETLPTPLQEVFFTDWLRAEEPEAKDQPYVLSLFASTYSDWLSRRSLPADNS